ncbi:hypothetical protein TorRG33x02_312320, partial [Trema orientale]
RRLIEKRWRDVLKFRGYSSSLTFWASFRRATPMTGVFGDAGSDGGGGLSRKQPEMARSSAAERKNEDDDIVEKKR